MESPEASVVQSAIIALFHACIAKEEYEKAQEYLDRLPQHGFSPKKERALLCRRQGKKEEACRLYEELVYSGYLDISMAMNGLLTMAMEAEDMAKAEYLAEKSERLAGLLEMGTYVELSSRLGLALNRKEKEETLQILEKIVRSVKDIGDFSQSRLYEHMTFSKAGPENIVFMLEKALERDEDLEFLKEDERFARLCAELKGDKK